MTTDLSNNVVNLIQTRLLQQIFTRESQRLKLEIASQDNPSFMNISNIYNYLFRGDLSSVNSHLRKRCVRSRLIEISGNAERMWAAY